MGGEQTRYEVEVWVSGAGIWRVAALGRYLYNRWQWGKAGRKGATTKRVPKAKDNQSVSKILRWLHGKMKKKKKKAQKEKKVAMQVDRREMAREKN
jgi:hypothetical protein